MEAAASGSSTWRYTCVSCSGDPVQFKVPPINPYYYSYGMDFTCDKGTAVLNEGDGLSDSIQLDGATNVTFTSVVYKYFDYLDHVALTITNCIGCTLQNVAFEDVRFSQLQVGGTVLRILDSDVILDGAIFTNLGWDDIAVGGSAGVLSATNSKVTLHNVSFFDVLLKPGDVSTVTLDGGALLAINTTWRNLSLDANHGRLLTAVNGADVELRGCTASYLKPGLMLFALGFGAGLTLAPDNRLFLPGLNGTGDTFKNLFDLDSAGPLAVPDFKILLGGTPEQPQPVDWTSPAWSRATEVTLRGFIGEAWPQLRRFTLAGASEVTFRDMELTRLEVLEGSVATLHNVTFRVDPQGSRPPLLYFGDSEGSLNECIFQSMKIFDRDQTTDYAYPAGVLLRMQNAKVNITSCTFDDIAWGAEEDFTVSSDGPLLYAEEGSVLQVEDTSFRAIGGSGSTVFADYDTNVVLERVNFTDVSLPPGTSGSGRAALVVIGGGSSLAARHCLWGRIDVGESSSGAALDVRSGAADVTLTSCNFTDINVPMSPAVQSQGQLGRLTVSDCRWENVNANGPLYIFSNTTEVTVQNAVFMACNSSLAESANGRGSLSLICVPDGNSTITLSGLEFTGNNGGTTGGLLVVECNGTVDNSLFQSNGRLTGSFGAITAMNSSVAITASIFLSNQCSAGGAVAALGHRTRLTISNCSFTQNTADTGGAVLLTEGAVGTVSDSDFLSNSATAFGGGIAVDGGATLQVYDGTTFTRNRADTAGGALSNSDSSTLTLTGVVFLANFAVGYGGAVSTSGGGGIGGGGQLRMFQCVLTGNLAANGGALCVNCGSSRSSGSSTSTTSVAFASPVRFSYNGDIDVNVKAALLDNMEAVYGDAATARIDNCTFAQNACTGEVAGIGGAVLVNGRAFLRGCSFVSNSCNDGGATAFEQQEPGGWVALGGNSFRFNYASVTGGAVKLINTASSAPYAVLVANSFVANSATQTGGAVHMYDWAMDLVLNNFTANGNRDTKVYGGAIFMMACRNVPQDGTGYPNVVSWRNSYVENAAQWGGGGYARACNLTSMYERYIGNWANDGGGALTVANSEQTELSTLQVYGAHFESNYAKGPGGAVSVESQGVTVFETVFLNNTARIAGGAITIVEASPTALLVLQRGEDIAAYSSEEYNLLQAILKRVNFTGNSANSGGGAIYSDTSRMTVEGCVFEGNRAGDGVPNDEWSDSGGAIFAAQCYGMSEVRNSNFTANRATGGPGGALVLNACSFALTDNTFDCNECSTFGGAVAAGDVRQANDTVYDTPNLTVLRCNFTDNRALVHDGGALLARDMNTSVFVSTFKRNTAGRNGGAVAFLNNLGSILRVCSMEYNSAVQYGGAAYAVTNSLIFVEDCDFRSNYAVLSGGAMSVIESTCFVATGSSFLYNSADVYGGALQLQPPSNGSNTALTALVGLTDGGDDGSQGASGGTCKAAWVPTSNSSTQAAAAPCLSNFLRQASTLTSPRGMELLGVSAGATLTYNATLVYDEGESYLTAFGRGGLLLSVPRVTGPAQFFRFDVAVVPGPGSVVQLEPGSSLAVVDWTRLSVQGSKGLGSHLRYLDVSAGGSVEDAVVVMAPGSAITKVRANMTVLPPGYSMAVLAEAFLVGPKLDVYTPTRDVIPALSVILSYKSTMSLPDGSKKVVDDWNVFVVRAVNDGGVFLLDATTGVARGVASGMTVDLANGSPLLAHTRESAVTGGDNVTVLEGGAWLLANGTKLSPVGSLPAVSAVPANGSVIQVAGGSVLTVDSWLPYNIRAQAGKAFLELLSAGASMLLAPGVFMSIPSGSILLTPPVSTRLLPAGTSIGVQGTVWNLGGAAAAGPLTPSNGSVAMGVALPWGSVVKASDGSTTVVRDWNRYVVWGGPMGSVMHDAIAGVTSLLTSSENVVLSRPTPLVQYDAAAAAVSRDLSFTVGKRSWALSNRTTLNLNDRVMAFTAILAKDSRITPAAGTRGSTIDIQDWYRYLVVATANGTYLYDTAFDGSSAANPAVLLRSDTRVRLGRGSSLVVHDSFTSVLSYDQRLLVQEGGLLLGNQTVMVTSDPRRMAVVLPGKGSSLVYGSAGGLLTLGSTAPRRFVPWACSTGSYLYDTELLATIRLANASSLQLTNQSLLLVHDSGTMKLSSETILTASAGPIWSLGNGTTLSLGGDVAALSASPVGASRVIFNSSRWSISVDRADRYSLQAGRVGTTLYDELIHGSYLLTPRSVLSLSNSSVAVRRDSPTTTFGAPTNLTVNGPGDPWILDNGDVINPGSDTGSTDKAPSNLHVGSSVLLDGELGRLCSVDLNAATYQADPFAYDYAATKAYLTSLTSAEVGQRSFYGNFARAAYGYGADVDVSGFNAALLVPKVQAPWDPRGRPTSAIVTCTAVAAADPRSLARTVSQVHLNLTFVNNTAGSRGGGVYLEGGQASVFFDNVKVENNTVLKGDGGGLALYQTDTHRDMNLKVYVSSSHFSANRATTGSGGAISLDSSLLHQQAVLLNTTLERNVASSGGGLSLQKRASALLNESLVDGNAADVTAVAAVASVGLEDFNYGNGGGIMASSCNELQLTHSTRLVNNRATGRGGGLAAYACGLLLLNDTTVRGNTAQSAGGVYAWSDLPATGNRAGDVGGSIAIVARSNITHNRAFDANTTDDVLEGIGGGFLARGRVSTLLADSYFEGNTADSQGGSIFIESTCDLTTESTFRVQKIEIPTAFTSAKVVLKGTIESLQWPRPKGCWGTVVYLPRFYNNEAARSGGALFASHPEALSLVCNTNGTATAPEPTPVNYNNFNESALADQVLMAMKKASYQVLDNRIVQNCYREEIERIYNRSIEELSLSGTQLSTLDISDNRAFGYGYLIAIIPSKLQVVNVTWSGNTSNVATDQEQQQGGSVQRRRRQLATAGSETSGAGALAMPIPHSLADSPRFTVEPGVVYDKDTQDNRSVLNYHIITYSNKPMDLPVLLLDALDQIAAENTTLRQAQVRARLAEASNGCKAELLGGYEGTARNGTALMVGMRLRAIKGENYSVEFRVEDAIMQGTVEPLLVNITIPPCSIGEVPRDEGFLCQKCDQRSFSLWQDTEPLVNCSYPDLSDLVCYPCPDGAECLGGAVIVPRKGFWHSAANSTFMNACPNPEACRGGDNEAQDILVACQEWWYARPQGFDYRAYINSLMSGNATVLTNSSIAIRGGSNGLADLVDPSLCVLWGLPYDHPMSYMQKQCSEGYSGNLCAVCAPVDGAVYAPSGDFNCGECFSRGTSIAIAVLGFVANVLTVLVTIIVTFMTDYTEDEDVGIGDLLKVLIVHMQFFVIVTRLNIEWPRSVSGITSIMSAFTGAVSKVYAPSCLLGPNASPEDNATVNQLAALITPLLTTQVVAALWLVIRFVLFNFGSISDTEQKVDIRTIEEFKADKARRAAAKRRLQELKVIQDAAADASGYSAKDAYGQYLFDAYTDLRASELLNGDVGGKPDSPADPADEFEDAGAGDDSGSSGAGSGGDMAGASPFTGAGTGGDCDKADGGAATAIAAATATSGVGGGKGGAGAGEDASAWEPGAAAGAANGGSPATAADESEAQAQAVASELARLLSPPREGEAYGNPLTRGATVHLGLPMQEAATEDEAEGTSTPAGSFIGGGGGVAVRNLSTAATERRPLPKSFIEEMQARQAAANLAPDAAAAAPAAESEDDEEDRGSGNSSVSGGTGDALTGNPTPVSPITGHLAKAFLPLPPLSGNMSSVQSPTRHSHKQAPSPPPAPPPAPPAPPPAPLPPAAQADSATSAAPDDGGGGSKSSRSSASTVFTTAVATITARARAQQLPPPPRSAANLGARPSPVGGAPTAPGGGLPRAPSNGNGNGPTAPSPFANAAAAGLITPLPKSVGGGRPPVALRWSHEGPGVGGSGGSQRRGASGSGGGGGADEAVRPSGGQGRASSSNGAMKRLEFGAASGAADGEAKRPGQRPRPAAYANLTVHPVVPVSSRGVGGWEENTTNTGLDPERGDHGAGGDTGGGGGDGGGNQRTGGGPSREGSGREGGAESKGSGSRSGSGFLRRKLTAGSRWFRSFFTYDEDTTAEDGQVRWASLANIHRTMAWWRQELLVVMIACFVLYPAWAQATLQIFACYYLDDGTGYYPEYQLARWGKGYWILNMNQECYLGDHARIWVPIGIVCILIICIGIPFLTFMVTWTHRTALRTVHVVQTYGFLYRRYNYERFYWWEAVMQMQTLMLVVVDVFGRVLVVYQQAVLLMLALMAIMWSNMFFQPLKHKQLERMSSLSLAVLSFTVALGLFFVPPSDRKDPVSSAVATAIGAIIVALNAGLLLYFMFAMWKHGREAIDRNVTAARQRMISATSKVQKVVRHHVSSASQNLRSMTSYSWSMMMDKVQARRRGSSGVIPPITPHP